MTLKYCRDNVWLSVAFIGICTVNTPFLLFGSFFIATNRYHLPFACYIFFLSVEGNTFNWAVNYVFQLFVVIILTILFLSHFVLTLLLMDQSCWIVDAAILNVNKIDVENTEEQSQFKQFFKKIVEEIGDVIGRLNNIKQFVRRFFLADVTLLASMFCMYFYSVLISESGNVLALAIVIIHLSAFFLHCWMGSKLHSKLAKLTASIYAQNWHLLSVRCQSDLKLILLMSQHIRGFDGVFKTVDLATFQKVCDS